MKHTFVLRAWQAGCLALCLVFLAQLFSGAQTLERLYPAIGARYESDLTKEQITAALLWQGGPDNGDGISASFWRQDPLHAKTPTAPERSTAATAIGFCGGADDCYAATYLNGAAPGSGDTTGCAVSQALAWALWGSTDVVGMTLTLSPAPQAQEGAYTPPATNFYVRGVFAETDAVVLYGADASAGFPNVELAGVPRDDPAASAQHFLSGAGLGTPAWTLYGPQLAGFARVLCWLPLVLAGLGLLVALLQTTRHWPALWRDAAWFLLAMAAAALLPCALAALPGWMIPSRWSDFSFWSDLGKNLTACWQDWQNAAPLQKDMVAKNAMRQTIGWLAATLLCAAAAFRLLCVKTRPKQPQD